MQVNIFTWEKIGVHSASRILFFRKLQLFQWQEHTEKHSMKNQLFLYLLNFNISMLRQRKVYRFTEPICLKVLC